MDVIPTYEEYKHSKLENVVKTTDGEYFLIIDDKTLSKRDKWAVRLCSLLFGITFLVLQLNNLAWPMLVIDFSIASAAITLYINRIVYRHVKFERIDPTDPYHKEVSQWHFKKSYPILRRIFYGLSIMVFMLQSYSIACIYSLFNEDAQIVSVEISSNRKVLYTDTGMMEGTISVSLTSKEMESFKIKAEAEGTPRLIRVMLDNKPIKKSVYRDLGFNWIWGDTYLKQKATIFILGNSNVHDGAVLEIICGDLRREWVFHLSEERGDD